MDARIVTADIGGLFWLAVVIISIIGQIRKSAQNQPVRRTPQPGESPHPPPTPAQNPQQELQDFLESLTGQAPRRVAPAPAPAQVTHAAPPTPPPVRTITKEFRREPPRQKKPRKVAKAAKEAKVAMPVTTPRAVSKATTRKQRAMPAHTSTRLDVGLALASRKGLRRGILLREILSPPLALR